MPFSPAQIQNGGNYQIDYYLKNKVQDQVNRNRPLLDWLVKNKVNRVGGNGNIVEQIRIGNDSNYQNYFGDDQVSYNKKDTVRQAKYPWFNNHDGFTINEDEARANGLIITDERNAQASKAEVVQLTNLITEKVETLEMGMEEGMDYEFHRDGSQSTKAVPGLDSLVSTTPGTGVVGTIDPNTSLYWRNNSSLSIPATAGALIAEMEKMWRACMLYGGRAPDFIPASGAFIDAYAKDVRSQAGQIIQLTTGKMTGGVPLDGSRSGVWFKGVELTWDPTMDILDALYGTPSVPWAKRAYFLNSKNIRLRPVDGYWMVNRKPPRLYDRYAYYWALTNSYSLTTNQRNALAVLSIA